MPLDPAQATQRFYELIWPLRSEVLRLAKILCGNDADAEDLAQETLLKAFAGIEGFQTGSNARAWLMQILRNARIDRIRSDNRQPQALSLEQADLETAAEQHSEDIDAWAEPEQVMNAFSDQQIIDALQDLPEEIRLTLLLVDVAQLDHGDAAKILQVPLGTIKSRTHRGRAMLRQALLPLAMEMKLVK